MFERKWRFLKLKKLFAVVFTILTALTIVSCDPIDKDYGVNKSENENINTENQINNENLTIMSLDRVMSNYFDISLFDEENYADIYLGKKFNITADYGGTKLNVPCKLSDLEEQGWKLADGNSYDGNSLMFSYETVDVVLINNDGLTIETQFFNSSRSSKKLEKCYAVKFTIENDFYLNPESYNKFNINGITNEMAITDIVQILGTPSHFYKISENSYYLDYFITKKDRRNGLTFFVNPLDDLITKIEFSYYE